MLKGRNVKQKPLPAGREGLGWVTNAKNKYTFFKIFIIFISSDKISVITH